MLPCKLQRFMHGSFFEAGGPLSQQAEFAIGIVAAMLHPSPKKQIAAADKPGCVGRFTVEQFLNRRGEFRGDNFVCIERQNPFAGAFVECSVLLRAKTLPRFSEEACLVFGGDGGVCDRSNLRRE